MLITLPTLQPQITRAEAIEDEITKLEGWLGVPSVIASGHWTAEIHTKLDRLRTELAKDIARQASEKAAA